MRRLIKILMFLLGAFWSGGLLSAAEQQTRLLSDLDIPLMPGFWEDPDSRVVFDTPGGRIIEVRATGPLGAKKSLDYYRVVLPSLAWQNVTNAIGPGLSFRLEAHRDGEILILDIREESGDKGKTVIYFSVNPE